MIWNDVEKLSRSEMESLQSERLVKLVSYVYNNVAFYKNKMDSIKLKPSDIKGVRDLEKLPFTTKDDLRDNYPYGLFACPKSDIVRIHASSGTTGKPTIVAYTKNDLRNWTEAVARCLTMTGVGNNDIIQIAYGYGLFTGGLGAHSGAERVGAMVVPMSTGNTKKLIDLMLDLEATAIACTPSYLLHIEEVLRENNLLDKVKIKTAICGAEPWSEEMRLKIEKSLNIKAFDIYGLSEITGPGVACDCEKKNGMHICEDMFLPEIVDTQTFKPLEDGEYGELVFTTLLKEALPLIRYRTKDITKITHEPCECGRTTARIAKFKGRSDDMLIIRGVNVFPSQIETVLMQIEEILPYYLIIVDRVNNLDTLEIMVEVKSEYLSDEIRGLEKLNKKIAKEIQQLLGINATIKLVEMNTIERTQGKSIKVIDKRKIY